MKFSIIIPVFNIEKYIAKCIESILDQTYKDYEIIIVDDGSTDSSGKICDDFSKKYSNIKIIHKKNGGLSSARNVGIKEAMGEYLMFIDGDDFLNSEDNLQYIAKQINQKNKPDIIQYRMLYYYEEKNKFMKLKELEEKECNENTKIIYLDRMIKEGILSISACDKVVKRSIVLKNNIMFNENILSEDIDWSLKLYLNVKSIATINKEIYVYRQQRKGSITNKVNTQNISSIKYILKYWVNFNYKDEKIKRLYFNYLAYQYIILLTIINRRNCNKNLKKEIYDLKFLLKYDNNYKVKLSNKIYKLFGISIGTNILKIYLLLKNKGILKL